MRAGATTVASMVVREGTTTGSMISGLTSNADVSPKLRLSFMYTVPERVRMAYMICGVASWVGTQLGQTMLTQQLTDDHMLLTLCCGMMGSHMRVQLRTAAYA